MVKPRSPLSTVQFVDEYCLIYQNLFPEVRSFEYFKYLHLGIISDIKRKTLPAIAKEVGLENGQAFPIENKKNDGFEKSYLVRKKRFAIGKSQRTQRNCPVIQPGTS